MDKISEESLMAIGPRVPIPIYVQKRGSKIYVDASGKGIICYYVENTGAFRKKDNLLGTHNVLEYMAVEFALECVAEGSEVDIYSDSMLVVNQLQGHWRINEDRLREMRDRCRKIIHSKNLTVRFHWTPRTKNFAGKLIDRMIVD